ncbi:discoidin domain-containing protein [bacterium]|nr:discoidin domain-containing protein [bacterium]
MPRVAPWLQVALLLALTQSMAHAGASAERDVKSSLAFVCGEENDLYRVLTGRQRGWRRFQDARAAIDQARDGSGVLILADGYPAKTTAVAPGLLEKAAAKKLRLYIEYPSWLPGLEVGEARRTEWERAVVASHAFGASLPPLSILAIHDCHYLPTQAAKPLIVLARVAGFDKAVFGLPKETAPILFEHSPGQVLVATTKLSQFVTARYGPAEAWATIWGHVLAWLRGGAALPRLAWTPTVRPTFGRDTRLPADAEQQAFRRGAEWFRRAQLRAGPAWSGRDGLLEGYSSRVRLDGSQPVRRQLRNDCMGESSLALALAGVVTGDAQFLETAANLNDFIYTRSVLAQGPRADARSPSFGLVGWTTTAHGTYYGDDNARSLLGTMGTAALQKSQRWDVPLLRCILANFRTCGRYGFRSNVLSEAALKSRGWRHYYNAATVNYAPHYEAHIWACYLWAYHHTGWKPLLERARTALRMTVAAYPDQWRWTNGIQQERARMLLPLTWLVRVDDTPEHRAWLRQMATAMLADQVACGAIREAFGRPGQGTIPPPASNADYGKHEAPIIQENGDPVCDLLYTGAFALLGLHEAAAATGDPLYRKAEDRLAAFLCRIQVRSQAHPELDGAWFRAFDFKRWEYFGSNADAGWGAWCIETGWKQAWIVTVLGLRERNTSLWELSAHSTVGRHFDELRSLMIPEGDAAAGRLAHLALDKPLSLATAFAPQYSGGGATALTDGFRGRPDHRDTAWQGYLGCDLVATIDLGKAQALRAISTTFLQSTPVGIWLPTAVEYAVSDDGKTFRVVATVKHDVPEKRPGPLVKAIEADLRNTKARWLRVRASTLGTMPAWHPAKGRQAWLFADEVVVR